MKEPIIVRGDWPQLNDVPALEYARGDHTLVVAGSRIVVAASATRGVHEIFAHPVRLLANLLAGKSKEIVRTPVFLRRDIDISGVAVTEHITAAVSEPTALWCWRAAAALESEFVWTVDLNSGGEQDCLEHDVRDSTLRVLNPRTGAVAVFAFSEPVYWQILPADTGGIQVVAKLHLPPERDVWLAVAGGANDDEIGRVTNRFADIARIPLARAAAFRKRARERIRTALLDDAVSRAVANALDRVETSLIELPRGTAPSSGYAAGSIDRGVRVDSIDAAFIASAALAAGDTTLPRATLRFLHAVRTSAGHVPARCTADGSCTDTSDDATAAWLELAARYHAWTGDDGVVRELWPDLLTSARSVDAARFGPVFRALAITAESLGDPRASSDFSRAAGTSSAPPIWLRSGSHTNASTAATGADLSATRENIAAARANITAARTLLDLVHRAFGLEPDAPRGRLRAHLFLPARWPNARLDNIRVGDARVSIAIEQTRENARITAAQTAGAVPLRLILEPALRHMPRDISIDGSPAQLDLKPLQRRIVAPVQLELDHARTVEFRFST